MLDRLCVFLIDIICIKLSLLDFLMRIYAGSIRFVDISSNIDEEKKHTIEVISSLSDGILLVCFLFAYLCICFLMQKAPVEEVLLCTINVHLVVAEQKDV